MASLKEAIFYLRYFKQSKFYDFTSFNNTILVMHSIFQYRQSIGVLDLHRHKFELT